MLDTLVHSVENAFVQFSVRRLLYLSFLLGIVLGGLYVFDRQTGYSAQRRLEMRLNALERLRILEEKGVAKSTTLGPIYSSLVAQLGPDQPHPTSWRPSLDIVVRLVAATLMPALFVLAGLVSMLRGRSDASMAIGAALFTIVLAVPAVFLPNIRSLAVTALVLALIQIGFIAAITIYYNRKNSKPADSPAVV